MSAMNDAGSGGEGEKRRKSDIATGTVCESDSKTARKMQRPKSERNWYRDDTKGKENGKRSSI